MDNTHSSHIDTYNTDTKLINKLINTTDGTSVCWSFMVKSSESLGVNAYFVEIWYSNYAIIFFKTNLDTFNYSESVTAHTST